jgi:hypothetical protein
LPLSIAEALAKAIRPALLQPLLITEALAKVIPPAARHIAFCQHTKYILMGLNIFKIDYLRPIPLSAAVALAKAARVFTNSLLRRSVCNTLATLLQE